MAPPPKTPASRQSRDVSAQDMRARISSSIRQQQPTRPPSSQFAQSRRFVFPSSSRNAASQPPSSAPSPLATRGRQFRSQALPKDFDEDIEDESPAPTKQQAEVRPSIEGAQHDEMLLDIDLKDESTDLKRRHLSSSPPAVASRKRAQAEPIVVSSSPEPDENLAAGSDDEIEELLSPPKPSAPDQRFNNTNVDLPPPQTPARKQVAPRFKFTPAASTELVYPTQSSTPRLPAQPHFILPSQVDLQPTTAILPLLFSPRRRGDKYVPSGLAETVRDWVLEAGGQMLLKEPETVQVGAAGLVGPAGALIVEGTRERSDAKEAQIGKFLLVATEEGAKHKVQVGDTISARPGWSMDLVAERGAESSVPWQVVWGPV